MHTFRLLFLIPALFIATCPAPAQTQPPESAPQQPPLRGLPPGVRYDPGIPAPESFLGFAPGDWHIRHDQLLGYLKVLDAASDRVTLQEYGRTHEQRALVLLTVTHPENHRQLEKIRTQHLALRGPAAAQKTDLAALPAVLWMGFSVHGNEASGANAVPLVAYYLAAAQGPAIDEQLRNTVILIDPCINPDGYDRFVTWVNGNRGAQTVADPVTREHQEPWPSGRTNHYWFDLNRDYFPLVHPESRARLEQYYRWMPNLLLDFHEMGTSSTYFFQPGKSSAVHPQIPPGNQKLTTRLGQRFAAALDRIGSPYFSREIFDDFFIGKGSSYTDVTGSVGILFEQASTRGHRQEQTDGVLEFRDAIRNHVTSALTALDALSEHRIDFLTYQQEFFRDALREASRASVRGYVFGSAVDPVRTRLLLDLLHRHRILVHELALPYDADGRRFLPGSAFVIDAVQPQYRLLTSLFEKRTTFTDSVFYDISAWTLPLAYGVPCVALKTIPAAIRGKEVAGPLPAAGFYRGPVQPVAYAVPWSQQHAPRLLHQLLAAGVRTRTASRGFSAKVEGIPASVRFGFGTIVIPLGIQQGKSDTIRTILERAIRSEGIMAYGLSTGQAEEGVDLGSDAMRPLALPRVLLVAGSGVRSNDAGEVWHLLDRRIGMTVTLVEPAQLNRTTLDRYSVIIMPGGNYTHVDSSGVAGLRIWLEKGGTIVSLENAGEWLARMKLATLRFRSAAETGQDSGVARRPFAGRREAEAAQQISGAIVEASFDSTHPVCYGLEGDRLHLFRVNTLALEPSRDLYATPVVYAGSLLVSGYISKEHQKVLGNSAAVVVSGLGSGRVVQITDNPSFRGFWLGSERVLLNAIFFGQIIRSPAGGAERE
jgi:hypothetical protein